MGQVRSFADQARDFVDRCDVVVVGSGPGGAVVAWQLAEAGRDVVLVEEGPAFQPEDFVTDGAAAIRRLLREDGLRTTRGNLRMPTMQAIALGGGSLVNSAICVRPPRATLDGWCEEFNLRASQLSDLEPHFDAVEAAIGVAATPDEVQGQRNLLFREGCRVLGIEAEPIRRNVRGCQGSGECLTGCRARAKQSTDISLVPRALECGTRVYTSAQVRRVLVRGRRAVGVSGRMVRPLTGEDGPAFRIEARAVVLAAGCIATPVLLERSALAGTSQACGRNLQFHPGVAVMGVFDSPTDPGFGATQGYHSLAFVERGYKIETFWGPPGVLAMRLPGQGLAYKENLARLRHAAVFDAIATVNRSHGRVRLRRGSLAPHLDWSLDPRDLPILADALWTLAKIFFAAGAKSILPGVAGLPEEMHSLDEARVLRTGGFRPEDLLCTGNHVFSTTRMHGDPALGVVDELGRCHGTDNLFVADSGIVPRSPSVHPMLVTMALAHRVAGGVIASV